MLPKSFDAHEAEPRIYKNWEESGVFAAGKKDGPESYAIVIPPPNVTGSLHMGHALNNSLQDILIRQHRMRGFNVLWQPGTDHAGIATQMLVERKLTREGEPDRWALGREEFIKRVWAWKEESGGTITNQLRRLGASCDWSRERFTMDEGLSEAVLKVFVALHREGLIYKDKRLVNWDTNLRTAISDLEVQQVEKQGHLWHLRYPIENGDGRYLVVATTRPETMLGDAAVAVHPEDERYKDLIGGFVRLPIIDRLIPIVGDEHADPETGSGAVKITPAHDFNDFEVGKRHNLPMTSILDETGHLNDEVPEDWRGMERFEARKRVVEWFTEHGLLEKIEDHANVVPHGDRSGTVIEPMLTDQWYCDAPHLAKEALRAVADGETKFIPSNWTKTYNEWLNNIEPWCISRQLWWGHQIPAWYGPDGEIFVAHDADEAHALAKAHYGSKTELTRDQDVLDTWFSSALWPFSTLGWPEETEELARYYPTGLLVTGFDIIFFWVARMMMFGMHFMKDDEGRPVVPFKDVYIHALVRDEHGQKMSKSKGNVIDPLELIDQYGADALRFTLTAMAAQGRDVKLATSRVEGYRNFTTKLWNAVRFAEMNEVTIDPEFEPNDVTLQVNGWILEALGQAVADVNHALKEYRFNDAAGAVYRFAWNQLCDWYLEMAKPYLNGEDEAQKKEIRACLAHVIETCLRLAHPFLPFITEDIWQQTSILGDHKRGWLATSSWPDALQGVHAQDHAMVGRAIEMIEAVRSTRVDLGIKPGAMVPASMVLSEEDRSAVARMMPFISRLARIEVLEVTDEPDARAITVVAGQATICLRVEELLDLAAEIAKLEGDMAKLDKQIAGLDGKLSNEGFVAKAPEEVVAAERARRDELVARRGQLDAARQRMKDLLAAQS